METSFAPHGVNQIGSVMPDFDMGKNISESPSLGLEQLAAIVIVWFVLRSLIRHRSTRNRK